MDEFLAAKEDAAWTDSVQRLPPEQRAIAAATLAVERDSAGAGASSDGNPLEGVSVQSSREALTGGGEGTGGASAGGPRLGSLKGFGGHGAAAEEEEEEEGEDEDELHDMEHHNEYLREKRVSKCVLRCGCFRFIVHRVPGIAYTVPLRCVVGLKCQVDIHTHPYITAACAAGVVTKTTDRDSLRYTYNGTRRVRQLALGCESS